MNDDSLSMDDIRAGVAAGVISEAQAAHLGALADARRGARSDLGGLDEPFELFKGFNEIFIVVGLVILFMGWSLISGLSAVMSGISGGSGGSILLPLIGAGALWMLAHYFTLKRRMVAPSIALVVMFALMVFPAALSIGWDLGFNFSGRFSFAFGVSTLAMAVHFWVFRVPITTAFIAGGIFATLGSFLLASGSELPSPKDLLFLSSSGPFGWLTIGIGICAFLIAMTMDLTDPHRVTRRSASAFWLHVIAAPAIVNPVALTILDGASASKWIILAVFISFMALLAVITDRRSFLVAGVGYVVALLSYLFDEFAWAILILGISLVFLGAQWERLRGGLLRALPNFPGKDRLPPYKKENV